MEVEYTAWGPSKAAPSSSSSSSSSSYLSFFKWVVVVVMTVNIIVIQVQLQSSKQKLSEFTHAVEECGNSRAELSRLLTNEIVERVKTHPHALMSFASKAGQQLAHKLSFDLSSTQDFIGLFPNNLFQVTDNIITANFTNLFKTLSTFTEQLAEGVSIVFERSMYYYEPLTISSKFFNIFATQVEPLSNNKIDKDSSVAGNFFTNLPGDIQTALSDDNTMQSTTEGCIVLMSRLYATSWQTYFDKSTCSGHIVKKQAGSSSPIEVFKSLERGCDALNTGLDS